MNWYLFFVNELRCSYAITSIETYPFPPYYSDWWLRLAHEDRKSDSVHWKDAATTTAHSNRLISLLKYFFKLKTSLSTICENTDVCDEQYRCNYALYLMSSMSQCYSIIIDRGISAPRHGKKVVDGPNSVDKRYIYQSHMYFLEQPLVHYQKQISIQLHNHINVMQYFTIFYMTIANRMLLPLLHTASVWFHFSKTKNYWQHHWVKYGKIIMVMLNSIDVSLHYTLFQLCLSVTLL